MSTVGSSVILPVAGQPKTGPDSAFQSAARPYVVSFNIDRNGPPSNLYVRPDDFLFIEAIGPTGLAATINVMARVLLAAPEKAGQPDTPPAAPIIAPGPGSSQDIKLFSGQIFSNSAGPSTLTQQLPEGYLLDVSAFGAGVPSRGFVFVRGSLIRPIGGGTNLKIPLFADYIPGAGSIGWPSSRVLSPVEGPGFLTAVIVTNPAAGADWVQTIPANERWRPISLEAQLAVANSGAARPVEIVLDNGSAIYARMATNTTAPINATANVNFSNAGTPSTSIASDLYAQMPSGVILPAGHRVRSVTTNIVAGDAWSNIIFLVEKWIDSA